MRRLETGAAREANGSLSAGEPVLLSGTLYTARDAAHRRIIELLDAGASLPFDLEGAAIYYSGPTPAPPGQVIGSCGPTTSARMDKYTTRLLECGLSIMVGKGPRNAQVVAAIKRHGALYLCAVGGAGALIARHVEDMREVAFPELGCESVKALTMRDMPLVVGVDPRGGDIFSRDGR